MSSEQPKEPPAPRQHGVKGVYYGGDWLDIEDCDGVFTNLKGCSDERICANANGADLPPCPRSMSRRQPKTTNEEDAAAGSGVSGSSKVYDVLVVGAGCVGATIARELSKYDVKVLWIDAADDVSQGATKGNSGIVHAGYDDKPGSVRAKYCWKGNQMFPALDKELRFGYQKNGSLVLAFNHKERQTLNDLLARGKKNGVQNLKILNRQELLDIEPEVNKDAVAALYSPDAGNVIPYEFSIALAENAVDNGVELRIRRVMIDLKEIPITSNGGEAGVESAGRSKKAKSKSSSGQGNEYVFEAKLQYWEPGEYLIALQKAGKSQVYVTAILMLGCVVFAHYIALRNGFAMAALIPSVGNGNYHMAVMAVLYLAIKLIRKYWSKQSVTRDTPLAELVNRAGKAVGDGGDRVKVEDMLIGGSGSVHAMKGSAVTKETVKCRYIVNCAGGASDQIAGLVGDDSFKIKPRVGDYILLNRNQGHLAKHTIFPCPDPILGKGVLVQTTLWGNLILGPTARDMHKPEARDMSPATVQEYILSKCRKLVPSFDPKEAFHAFAGARAKSDVGDWIIGPSKKNPRMIHVAGIDSPGLAGAPAIACDVVKMLVKSGLKANKDPKFNPNRAPIITPKSGMKGLKMGPVGKYDSDGRDEAKMAQNVICKCEKVTELEVVRAMRRSLPIDSSQGIRKRTRAGMGHCQGDPDNYNCEARCRAIIARENGVPIDQVGGRPWPATSTLPERWIDDREKQILAERMQKA